MPLQGAKPLTPMPPAGGGFPSKNESRNKWETVTKSYKNGISQGEMPMSNQTHRTCVRMSEKEYQTLKEKSRAAGMSANVWLMRQLESNRPILFREPETSEVINFIDEVGREINEIARDFNSGFGSKEQLQYAVRRLREAYERVYELRKKGYPYAP